METWDLAELVQQITRLGMGRVLVIGDVMVDSYLVGDVQRISPEAPVPVVKVEEVRHLLGGAGNVARNIAALGGHATLVSVVGADSDGRRVETMLRDSLVEPRLLISKTRPTTVKTRVLARNQQMIRLDMEESRAQSEEEQYAILEQLSEIIDDYEIIVISDYGKGMIGPHLLPDLAALAKGKRKGSQPKILVDPKPLNRAFYQGAYLITPNTKETGELAALPVSDKQEVVKAAHKLRRQLRVENVLTTLGSDGMALFRKGAQGVHIATAARQVFDVTGAGDTVIATIALALSVGFPLVTACILANYAAGIVVGKVGAATASIPELSAAINSFPPEMSSWE